MHRTNLRRMGAGLTLLGTLTLGAAAIAAPAVATPPGDPPMNFSPTGSNTFGAKAVDTENCNGIIYTPGSDPATKKVVSGSLTAGGVVGFEVSDSAHANGGTNNYELHDCVISYPAGTFTSADFQDNGTGPPAPGSEGKFKGPDKTVLDQALLTEVGDQTLPVTYNWTVPSGIPAGTWICNFVKDTGNNHGGNGNRKAAACFQVVVPTTPTTPAPTTTLPLTPTVPSTSPTTPAPTTTVATTTTTTTAGVQVLPAQGTTTVAPTTTTTTPTQVLGIEGTRTLPFTGSSTTLLAAAGVLLLLGGLLLLGVTAEKSQA